MKSSSVSTNPIHLLVENLDETLSSSFSKCTLLEMVKTNSLIPCPHSNLGNICTTK